jgi:hypothetical protein
MPTTFATAMEGLTWGFSSQERTPGWGFSLVLLVWTDGVRRMPLGMRLGRQGGPSQYALTLALRSYARHRLRGHPESVLVEAK